MTAKQEPLYTVPDFAGDYKLPVGYVLTSGEFGVPGYTYISTRRPEGETLLPRDWKRVENSLVVMDFERIALKQSEDRDNILPGKPALGLPELNTALIDIYEKVYKAWCTQFPEETQRVKPGKIMLLSSYRRLGETAARGEKFEDIAGAIDSTDYRGHWTGLAVDVAGGFTRDSFHPHIIGTGNPDDCEFQEPWISLRSGASGLVVLQNDWRHYRVKKTGITTLGDYDTWCKYCDNFEIENPGPWQGWENALKSGEGESRNSKPLENQADPLQQFLVGIPFEWSHPNTGNGEPFNSALPEFVSEARNEETPTLPSHRWLPEWVRQLLPVRSAIRTAAGTLPGSLRGGLSLQSNQSVPAAALGFSSGGYIPAAPAPRSVVAEAARAVLARAAKDRNYRQYIDTVNIDTRGSFDAQKLLAALEAYGRSEVANVG